MSETQSPPLKDDYIYGSPTTTPCATPDREAVGNLPQFDFQIPERTDDRTPTPFPIVNQPTSSSQSEVIVAQPTLNPFQLASISPDDEEPTTSRNAMQLLRLPSSVSSITFSGGGSSISALNVPFPMSQSANVLQLPPSSPSFVQQHNQNSDLPALLDPLGQHSGLSTASGLSTVSSFSGLSGLSSLSGLSGICLSTSSGLSSSIQPPSHFSGVSASSSGSFHGTLTPKVNVYEPFPGLSGSSSGGSIQSQQQVPDINVSEAGLTPDESPVRARAMAVEYLINSIRVDRIENRYHGYRSISSGLYNVALLMSPGLPDFDSFYEFELEDNRILRRMRGIRILRRFFGVAMGIVSVTLIGQSLGYMSYYTVTGPMPPM